MFALGWDAFLRPKLLNLARICSASQLAQTGRRRSGLDTVNPYLAESPLDTVYTTARQLSTGITNPAPQTAWHAIAPIPGHDKCIDIPLR